ncbi:hypothetical protein TNCV_5063921 [Trichonephila clavipes]|nr:hypothetical protein TNCV_5063921 [Trichonephila clavipes]
MNVLLCSVVYLTRPQPNYQKLIRVHQNLVEYGPFRTAIAGTGRPRTERTPIFEEGVLYAVNRNSGTGCISQCAVSTERSRATVHRGTDYSQIIINDVPRLRIGLLTKKPPGGRYARRRKSPNECGDLERSVRVEETARMPISHSSGENKSNKQVVIGRRCIKCGCLAAFGNNVEQRERGICGYGSGRWIGHGGPVAWPPSSPDLNPLDFSSGAT